MDFLHAISLIMTFVAAALAAAGVTVLILGIRQGSAGAGFIGGVLIFCGLGFGALVSLTS